MKKLSLLMLILVLSLDAKSIHDSFLKTILIGLIPVTSGRYSAFKHEQEKKEFLIKYKEPMKWHPHENRLRGFGDGLIAGTIPGINLVG